MKNLFLTLLICSLFACKKDTKQILEYNTWVVEAITVSPAQTIASKTSTDYLLLSGPNSCAATLQLNFSKNGVFTSGSSGSSGSLCDQPAAGNVIKTWTQDGNTITVSTDKYPYILTDETLTHTSKSTDPKSGIEYTYSYRFKIK